MNADLLRRVRLIQSRSRHYMPVATAVRIARYEAAGAPEGYEFLDDLGIYGRDTLDGVVNGIDVRVTVEADQDWRIGDDDVTGTFTSTYTEGAVKNTGGERNSYEWYLPCTDTLTNTFNELRAAGMSKSVARERYAEIVQQEMDADRTRSYLGVIVTLSLDGVELAETSLWGIDNPEDGDSRPYLIEVAVDLIDEAMRAAEQDAPSLAEKLRARAQAISERFPVENAHGELITDGDESEDEPNSYYEAADAKHGYPPLETDD